MTPAVGNPAGSGTGSTRSPRRWPAAPARSGSATPPPPLGRSARRRFDRPESAGQHLTRTQGAGPTSRNTRRGSGTPAHRSHLRKTVTPTRHNQTKTVILKPSQRPNPTRRKIEVSSVMTTKNLSGNSEAHQGHVEVFRLGGVATPLIGRPRPLPRDRHADHPTRL